MMRPLNLSQRLPLPLLLATLILLLAVNLRTGTANDCDFKQLSVDACNASCFMSAQTCHSNCHQVSGNGCPTHERKLFGTSVKASVSGDSHIMLSMMQHTCHEQWSCSEATHYFTQCLRIGDNSTCNVGQFALQTCYTCTISDQSTTCPPVPLRTLISSFCGG